MNKTIGLFIALFALAPAANAMSVNNADIAGKTDLVQVATVTVNGNAESILVDSSGISLYTFQNDTANVSNCSGKCLREWPPEHVPSGATVEAPFGVIKGNDGQNQLTVDGAPLYHYDDDKKPGDAFGQYPGWDAVTVEN